MGQFSWLDCAGRGRIINGKVKTSYLLIPQEFGGGHIAEECYDGYGHFGGYDVYDLVAEWNKSSLKEELLEPAPELKDFGGLWSYEVDALIEEGKTEEEIKQAHDKAREGYYKAALKRRENLLQMMKDFQSLSKEEFVSKYGTAKKREIGIAIACYDKQNAAIPYGIKATYDAEAVYEDCPVSRSDPNQGWGK